MDSEIIKWLTKEGELRVIDKPLDVELEIPHIAYLEIKKPNAKPLLFTKPVYRAKGIEYDMPVLMNIFASYELTQKILGKHPDIIAEGIEELMHLKPPKSFLDKLNMIPKLFSLRNVFPKRSNKRGVCQEIVIQKSDIDLNKLPILKTWSKDGGRFITMGQVYTQSLDGNMQNLGMYRLQQYDKKRLGMHWQIHKDASSFFDEYKKAGKKMPVSVAIGGDPLYIWCGQAPMPHGMFELLLYGFIRGKNAQLVKSITNDIYIPKDVDIVIEGFVDPSEIEIEGPFGDHTGYYTLPEPFPVMEVETITMKKDAVFSATVVGKPPLEDKYMGWATERIFLPMLKPLAPELIDYNMPENGVFHNLILAKMDVRYTGHAKQFMHAFWGVGQMSFVKHAIFVSKEAPKLTNYKELAKYILDRVSAKSVLISEGIIDQLDHSSPKPLVGGKLGVDATGDVVEKSIKVLPKEELLSKLRQRVDSIIDIEYYMLESNNPIVVVAIDKRESMQKWIENIYDLSEYLSIFVAVDCKNNDLSNPYMLLWRVLNNIDANRDIGLEPFIWIDGTNKSAIDGYNREWPDDTLCDKDTLLKLAKEGIIEENKEFWREFGIVEFECNK